MDLIIDGKKYEFLLFHTHVAEDMCKHSPVNLEFKKTDTCYLSDKLPFEIPSAIESQVEKHLMAPFVYYVKETNNVMINYIEREIPEGLMVTRLGIYLKDEMDYLQDGKNENKVCEYFKNAPKTITFKIV